MQFNRFELQRGVLLKVVAVSACALQGCASTPAVPADGAAVPKTVVYCDSRFARGVNPSPLAARIPCLTVY